QYIALFMQMSIGREPSSSMIHTFPPFSRLGGAAHEDYRIPIRLQVRNRLSRTRSDRKHSEYTRFDQSQPHENLRVRNATHSVIDP
ncbi:MAG TPA: hypothetical protein VGA18_07175, partial [Rhodothermales bacterium]